MREQELKLEKVKKSCKTTHTIINVLKILTIVACVICLIAAVICYTQQKPIDTAMATAIADNNGAITMGDPEFNGLLQFQLDMEEYGEAGHYGLAFAIYSLFGALVTAGAAIVLHLISRIFANIEKSESPFTEGVLKTLHRSFIILTVVTFLFVGVGSGLFLGLFLWCIYRILEYGAVLQTEVDETL